MEGFYAAKDKKTNDRPKHTLIRPANPIGEDCDKKQQGTRKKQADNRD
jgi:hypothetical protein